MKFLRPLLGFTKLDHQMIADIIREIWWKIYEIINKIGENM
jgi:hypothetical protein